MPTYGPLLASLHPLNRDALLPRSPVFVPGGIFEAELSMNAINIFVRYDEGHRNVVRENIAEKLSRKSTAPRP